MRSLAVGLSVGLHLAIIIAMSTLPDQKSLAASKLVEMTVRQPPPPPPPPPPVEEKKEEPRPPPEVKPKLVKKRTAPKIVADEPPPPPKEPPKETPPPPPPTGFSVDMSATVVGGSGVAVPAIENGGNMFANPNDKTLEPGKKQTERPPEEVGKGKGTAPAAAYQVTKMPEFIGDEDERKPPYPESAKARGIEGTVVLKVFVGKTGRVEEVRILKRLDPECDANAIKWAKEKFRFRPAMAGDEPVGVWIDVPVRYELER